mgnify:CR=1
MPPPNQTTSAKLVSTNLRQACGRWVRLCPGWWFTGSPAVWTTTETNY